MTLILTLLFYLSLGLLFSYFLKVTSVFERRYLSFAAVLKVILGLGLGFIYVNYFNGGDSLRYFEEVKNISESTQINLWGFLSGNYSLRESSFVNQPRAQFFLRFSYIIYFLSYENFWLMNISFSLISFTGALYFYHTVKRVFSLDNSVLMIALFFWPSIVFWSGGILKESISLPIIYLISGSFIWLIYERKRVILNSIIIVLGSLILFKIKYYYAVVLLPILIAFGISYIAKIKLWDKKPYLSFLLFFFLMICFSLLTTFLHPNLSVTRLIDVMVNNYYVFESKSEPGKMVIFQDLSPDVIDLIYYSPKALFAGWFRPFFFDVENIWSALTALEHTLLLILCLFQLKNIKKLNSLMLCSLLCYCVVMAVFLSYSAPNFGTLVRYKVGFYPFLVGLVLLENPLYLWVKNKFGIRI